MRARSRALPLVVGITFGFFLSASGLGDYRTIHNGLLLRDPYIYLMMAATIGTGKCCSAGVLPSAAVVSVPATAGAACRR